jgi:hypothetical protein
MNRRTAIGAYKLYCPRVPEQYFGGSGQWSLGTVDLFACHCPIVSPKYHMYVIYTAGRSQVAVTLGPIAVSILGFENEGGKFQILSFFFLSHKAGFLLSLASVT